MWCWVTLGLVNWLENRYVSALSYSTTEERDEVHMDIWSLSIIFFSIVFTEVIE